MAARDPLGSETQYYGLDERGRIYLPEMKVDNNVKHVLRFLRALLHGK
jgi:hypothetical protein